MRDSAILLKAMAGHDVRDSTSADVPVPDYEKLLEGSIKGLRVGIPKEYRVDGAPAEIDALWHKGAAWLKEAGAEIVEVSLPRPRSTLPIYPIAAPAQALAEVER